ncbi:hypothetical protein FC652_15800 [Vibrio sp. 05-20-BW147]|uniref:lipopolysaccharide biosynthesis protein n=1 Tax=Vibrio sp. 05-20-BW147 TaxID=2575834 RepID=UPI0015934707|nr:hypothetical protein [Vibrio sp. 05-20-BW147]NVC64579.1 hypothetical protein [Vibrio sp. 05-20-BW147]
MKSELIKLFNITLINLVAQLLSLCGFVILTKIAKPEIIGEYVVFLSVGAICSVYITGFYEQSLYVKPNNVHNYIKHVLIFLLATSSLSLVFLKIMGVQNYFYITLFAFFSGVKSLARVIAIVRGELLRLALFECVVAIIVPLFVYLIWLFSGVIDSQVMMMVNVVGTSFTAIICLYVFYWSVNFSNQEQYKWSVNGFYDYLVEFKKLPIQKMTAEIINVLTLRFPVIFIDKVFGSIYSAFYGTSIRIALSPVSIFCSSVAQIFTSKVIENKKNVMNLLIGGLRFTVALAFVGCLFIYFSIDFIILLVFGPEYEYVSVMIKCLIPYIFSLVAFSPFFSLFVIFEKQNLLLIFNVVIFVLTVCSYLLSQVLGSVEFGIFSFSCSVLVCYLMMTIKLCSDFIKGNNDED